MAYNSFYNYQPTYPPFQFQQPGNSIIWVQGIESAKSYPVGAGNTIILLDSENPVMYIKSADQAGLPNLRVFDYKEHTDGTPDIDLSAYITRQEFETTVAKLTEKKKKKRRDEEDDDE